MVASARVIWLCACDRGLVFECVTYFYSVCPIPHFPFLISPFPVLPFLHFSFRSPSLYFPIIIIPPFPLFANRNPRLGHFPVASCLWFKTSLSAKTSLICMKMNPTCPGRLNSFSQAHSFWYRGKSRLENSLLAVPKFSRGLGEFQILTNR